MNKLTTISITALVAVSAQAASVDVLGRNLSEKQQKNPGIVAINKAKNTVAAKPVTDMRALAKTYSAPTVTPIQASFDVNSNQYRIGQNIKNEYDFVRYVNNLEANDAARRNFSPINFKNSAQLYSPSRYNDCIIVDFTETTSSYTYTYDDAETLVRNDLGIPQKNPILSTDFYYNAIGQGIKVFSVVADKPVPNLTNCYDNEVNNYTYAIQALKVQKMIKMAAPLLNANETVNEGKARASRQYTAHPANPYENNYHIGNVVTSSLNDVSVYNNEAAVIDDYIYNNRVIEFVAYTNNNSKTGAGVSLNAISVAGIDIYGNTLTKDVISNPRFVSSVPTSNYNKPEVYNFSHLLLNGGDRHMYRYSQNNNAYYTIEDSWGASSLSAAMTAVMLSKYPFYKWHPEVVKAVWLTAGADPANQPIKRNGKDIAGKYTINMNTLMKNNKSRYWYGNNGDFFDNETITFSEKVEPGATYNAAIAWLVRGDYAAEAKNTSSSYKIRAYTSKGTLFTSGTTVATNRVGKFTVPSNINTVYFEITRTRNVANDRVILGFNLHKQ